MPIPDYQTLMLPVLKAAAEGEVRVSDVVEKISSEFGLTLEERAELLPSGRQTLIYNRIQWAKTYLKQAGLVEATRRAHFKATSRGMEALASNPTRIDNNYLSQFPEFIDFKTRGSQGKERHGTQAPVNSLPHALPEPGMAEELTPDEVMRSAHKDIERALRQEILDRVCAAPPEFFEQLVVNLLLQMGYGGSVEEAERAFVTGRTGDGGVDGMINQDALGLDRVYIQAKRYAPGNLVGASAIRDFSGSLDMRRATKGLFVTTSDFTQEALKTVDQLSRHVILINGDYLAALMIRYNVGVRIEETLYLKKIDEDFFLE